METGFPLASCSKLIESIRIRCDLCAFRDLFADAGANWPGAAIISAVKTPSNAFGARKVWPSQILRHLFREHGTRRASDRQDKRIASTACVALKPHSAGQFEQSLCAPLSSRNPSQEREIEEERLCGAIICARSLDRSPARSALRQRPIGQIPMTK